MKLIRFDYVDDKGNLHQDLNLIDVKTTTKLECVIYTFERVN